ncbi:aldehyde dehydrogenase family protein [Azotosporobacter soli]|uniref:aldehyde dehydrogenase family protein n=1 Tax=Azotosporobacter soli TaxID=3055040 RepID=UPI0031FE58C5
MSKDYDLYINGQFSKGENEARLTVINPSDESVVGSVPSATLAETDAAVAAARLAFDSGVWSGLSPAQRAEALLRIAAEVKADQETLVDLLIKESGSTVGKANGEVNLAIKTLTYYAKLLQSPYEEAAIAADEEAALYSHNFIRREAIGVCAAIVPWNFPLSLGVWKIAPALAAGNTIVVKPPSEAPLALLAFAKAVHRAGLPKGVFNMLTGSGKVIGEALAAHPLVDKVAFTGSTEVGKRVMSLAAQSNLKITTLELGGKSANILLEDADLDEAIDGALFAFLYHSGQVCESGTRLLVPRSKYEEVIKRLVERAEKLKIGDPGDPETSIGPVISKRQQEKIAAYISGAIKEGARLVLGGEPLSGKTFEKGFWVRPTIFADVKNEMTIAREEIFGPVLSVIAYDSEEEAIRIANDSIYGLGGGVWSKDYRRAVEVAKQLRTGTVWINSYHLLSPIAPFGGYKQSGIGRELGLQGLLAYTQTKHIHLDLANDRGARYQRFLGQATKK